MGFFTRTAMDALMKLPQDLGFVNRSIPENEMKLEVDFHVGKKQLKQILEKVINTHGATKTAEVIGLVDQRTGENDPVLLPLQCSATA